MSKPTKRRIEYWNVGVIGLILVIGGISLLFFNWIISLVLFCVALGIQLTYYYFFSLRAKIKIWRLIPTSQACLIFFCIIVFGIVILSTVSVIF